MKTLKTIGAFAVSMLLVSTMLSCNAKKTPDATSEAQTENKESNSDKGRKDDVDFAIKAADGGLYEVQLGQFAVANGTSDAVKQLGQMMVTDHSKANEELKSLSEKKGIVLPAVLGNKLQKKYEDIVSKKGVDFDKAYATAMVDDHKEDIDAFRTEASSGNDEGLKSWAAGKVPVLEHHLEMSRSTKDAVHK